MEQLLLWDTGILNFIQLHMRSAILDEIMLFCSWLGNNGGVWLILSMALLIPPKTRKTGFVMLLSLLAGHLLGNMILKPLVARVRPCDANPGVTLLLPRPPDYSFPSGHTLSSFAAATVFTLAERKKGTPFLVLAALIGFSRLYLYVHYPTDVFAGAVIGIGIAFFLTELFKNYKTGTTNHTRQEVKK